MTQSKQASSVMIFQANDWNRWNQLLVGASILIFLPLQVPQILRNMELIASDDPKAIAMLVVIPALGYASGMLGNLLLMNFLVGENELWGSVIQAVGMLTSAVVLTQLYSVGLVPGLFFIPFVMALAIGLVFNALNFGLSETKIWTERIWPTWQNGLRIVGLVALPVFIVLQIRDAFWPELPLWPSGIGFGLLASFLVLGFIRRQAESFPDFFAERNRWRRKVLEQSEWLDAWLRRGWQGLAGWVANLLFMFGPLAQCINGLVHPDSLAALALSTQFLCVVGHLLMFSRSGTLLVQEKDRIWCFGSIWEIALRSAIVFCIMAAGLLSPLVVSIYLVFVIGYVAFVFVMAKRDYPEGSLLTTIGFLAFGKQQATADSEMAMN
ncbi:hypothetical protein [Nodosilinea nodulosa]|uniref:hypothetical protein n=1 Tax=Nodosilinea nodulosa TaxID=416001 RepID=UPI0003019280|nr:hypothetical protein [Nodosilinea nodulosa]